MDGEGLPAAVGALMLGIDAHQRGAAQVPDLVGILGGVHDRSTGHGRVEVAQHGHGTLVSPVMTTCPLACPAWSTNAAQ